MPHKWANPMGNISAQRKSKITIGNELYTLTYYELYHGRHDINKWYLNTWTTPLWYEASNLGLWDHHNIPAERTNKLVMVMIVCTYVHVTFTYIPAFFYSCYNRRCIFQLQYIANTDHRTLIPEPQYYISTIFYWRKCTVPVRQPLALLVAPGSCVKYWMLAVLNSLWRHPLPEQDKNLPGECGCWSWFENGKQGAGRWPDSKWSQEWMKSGQWCSKGVSGKYRIEIEGRFDRLLC